MNGWSYVKVRWHFGSDFSRPIAELFRSIVMLNLRKCKAWPSLRLRFLSKAWDWGNSSIGLEKLGRNITNLWFVASFSSVWFYLEFSPSSLWCRLWDFCSNFFETNDLRGLVFHEFWDFWPVYVPLSDIILYLKSHKILKLTKTSFVVSDGRPKDNRGYTGLRCTSIDIYGFLWTFVDYQLLHLRLPIDLPRYHTSCTTVKEMSVSR